NGAWLTGLVIGILTLIQMGAVILFSSGVAIGPFIKAGILVIILFALSYGVWRKNKLCAVLLAVYFISLVAWKTWSWTQSKIVPWGILVDFLAMLLCLNGARGAFAYHGIKQSEAVSRQEYVEQQ
ncbi:MAG: hypothetical protein ACREAB_04440, partial [Blastocatellia bacterium]